MEVFFKNKGKNKKSKLLLLYVLGLILFITLKKAVIVCSL